MLLKRILSLAVAVSTIVLSASGQEKVQRLNFKEAVKLGLQNNLLFNQDKNQLEFTQVNKTSTLLQLGPTATAGLDAYRTDGNSFNQQDGRVVNGIVDYVGGRISVQTPVFAGFSLLNQHRAASNNNEAQLHKVYRSSQDAIALVANQYLKCLLDQELVKVANENVRVQKVTYDQIKEQARLGVKAEADAFNQEYLWRNAELQFINSKNTLTNDLATLAVTLMVDATTFVEVEQVEWDINELLLDSATFDAMYTTAMDRRADLKQATYAMKGAKLTYASRKGAYFPSVYAGWNYNTRYNYIDGADLVANPQLNRPFGDQFFRDNTQMSYGLSLNIPIFNSFIYRVATAQAKVLYKNATLTRKNVETTVKSDVVKANQNFSNAKKSYLSAQAQMAAGEYAYKMEKERYDLGISNIVQLSTVSQSYVQAQGDYQQALFTLMFQKILVSYAMGTLQIEDIP